MGKKIVFAIDTNTSGGGERVIATLANYMSDRGHDVILINSDSSSSFYRINKNVKIIKMGLDRKKTGRTQRFFQKYKFLKNFLMREKPEAIVAFLFNMEAPAILAALATHTRVFTSVRNAAWSYSKKERAFRRRFYPIIAGVIFQSKKVQHYKDFRHLKNSVVIMNPMADDVKATIKPVHFENRRNVIISVARLEKQKNHEMTIRAFSMISNEFPEIELQIFGEGSLKKELQDLIQDLDLGKRVYLKGTVEGAVSKNRDAKLFIMSSNFEGFPNALVESMVYGIPSISTDFDTGVASELIQEGKNGWLVNVGDVVGLSQKMRHVLSLKEKTDSVSEECVKIFSKVNSDVICKQWEAFILQNKKL